MFEPVHGSAPNIAGKGIANPLGAVLAAGMMCEYLGWFDEAMAIEVAVKAALAEAKVTADLGGNLRTGEVGVFLAKFVASAQI